MPNSRTSGSVAYSEGRVSFTQRKWIIALRRCERIRSRPLAMTLVDSLPRLINGIASPIGKHSGSNFRQTLVVV